MKANYTYLSDGTKAAAYTSASAGKDYVGSFTYTRGTNNSHTLEIVARDGRPIPEIFREGGESAFRAVELETLRAVLDAADAAGEDLVLALGGGTLTLPEARALVLSRTRCVWLRTRLETIRERLGASDASRPLFRDADALYAAREPIYAQAHHIVDTDGLTPAGVADAILDVLGCR